MTFSINTNNAAMAALQSLETTQSALNSTEKAVSTGLKVSDASDNPSIYAISSTMNANIAGLSAVSDSLSFGSSVLTTASSTTSHIISTLTALQNQVTEASTTGISIPDMQASISSALNDINSYARNSTFNGVNLLTSTDDSGATSGSMQIVESLNGSSTTIAGQAASSNVFDAKTLTDALGLTSGMAAGSNTTASSQGLLSANGASTGYNLSLSLTDLANANSLVLTNASGGTLTIGFSSTAGSGTAVGGTATAQTATIDTSSGNMSTILSNLTAAMNDGGFSAAVSSTDGVNVSGNISATATPTLTGDATVATSLSSSQALVNTVQVAVTKMTAVAANIGYQSQQITGLQSFTTDLSDAVTSGVGALVDADLSEESAKLTSLQTKQQLAIQSLSIANSQSQSILSLFR